MNWKKLADAKMEDFKADGKYVILGTDGKVGTHILTMEDMYNLILRGKAGLQYAEVTPENDPPVNVDWKFPDKDGMPIDNEDIERFAYWCNTTGTCWVYPTSLYGLRKHHYEGRLIAYAKIETPPPPVMPRAWKECPWCKSDNIVRMEDDEQHYGLCTKCWARGPSGKTPKEAMDRWGYKK